MPFTKYQWVPKDPTESALKYQKWIRVRKPSMGADLASMHKMVVVQQQKGTVDSAGGTPPDWEDYLTGSDGVGIWADIREPTTDEQVVAMAKNIKITHSIKMRADDRIKEDMRFKWWMKGVYHYATITTVTLVGGEDDTYMQIGAVEERHLAEAYS